MKISSRLPMMVAMYNRGLILVTSLYILFSLVPGLMDGSFGLLKPWMLLVAIIIIYPVNSLLLRKAARIIVPLLFDLVFTTAFEILTLKLLSGNDVASGLKVMGFAFGLALILSCISQFVWESKGLTDSVLKRHVLITVVLAVSGILIMDEIGTAFGWLPWVLISIVLALMAIAMRNRVSIPIILSGFTALGVVGLISYYLGEPAGNLVIKITGYVRDLLIPALVYIFNLFHLRGKNYSSEYVPGETVEIVVTEASGDAGSGSQIMGWIVVGFLGLAMAALVLFFLVCIMKWLLKKGLGISSPVIITGEKFSLKDLIKRIRSVIKDFRAYLFLRKHNDSIAYLIVSLERKYSKDSELSRKSWETPMEFVRKIDFGGEDFREFLAKNLYGSQKNLLATWNKK